MLRLASGRAPSAAAAAAAAAARAAALRRRAAPSSFAAAAATSVIAPEAGRRRRYATCGSHHHHQRPPSHPSVVRSARRFKSTAAAVAATSPYDSDSDFDSDDGYISSSDGYFSDGYESEASCPSLGPSVRRLRRLRNVGILAHVDAGKTTVTERMLALTGEIRRAGSVDTGDTVTDYLPMERERGITIQSAATSFEWGWHNAYAGEDGDQNETVLVRLIDTPGHVDFGVEVNRSVAVLDGAVLVVDAVAGVQAQTETVWRAVSGGRGGVTASAMGDHGHEPLPCLAMINKMDREGRDFGRAIGTMRTKLPGANPLAIQVPLFRTSSYSISDSGDATTLPTGLVAALPSSDEHSPEGAFAGVVDLVHMRAVLWPDPPSDDRSASVVEEIIPDVYDLMDASSRTPLNDGCSVTEVALQARSELISHLAEVDPAMEEYFLMEEEPSNAELRGALRRATLSRDVLPVLAGAALRGKGVEPLLDAVADLLPSPLDRLPPGLIRPEETTKSHGGKKNAKSVKKEEDAAKKGTTISMADAVAATMMGQTNPIELGHPLNNSLLALAFKVLHMKGRGGSGDGRVVFARVYSGSLKPGDKIRVVRPLAPGEVPDEKPRIERVGGMLELAGGKFDNLSSGDEGSTVRSGDVCALVGLKTVVTGDTILLAKGGRNGNGGNKSSSSKSKKSSRKRSGSDSNVWLAGVASPRPVLTVRLESSSSSEQTKLEDALSLLTVEDPSLVVEESDDGATLLSGLGELHVEIVLDRLRREFGLDVLAGPPAVAYRETVLDGVEAGELVEYDRTVGGVRMQAEVRVKVEPHSPAGDRSADGGDKDDGAGPRCSHLTDPVVRLGPSVREYLGLDPDDPESELIYRSELASAAVGGARGSLLRGGPNGPYPLSNVRCTVLEVDAEGGLPSLQSMPGSLRAATANAVTQLLCGSDGKDACAVLEPTMAVEVSVPSEQVGVVLSDLTSRRGTVGDVIVGDEEGNASVGAKALVRADVPLAEILGYANALRSLTGGEGTFTAEYRGHSPREG